MFQKKSGSDPLQALRDRVDENPKDAKLANDLATQLKAKGDLMGAVHYALVAATAHTEAGFLQKALAVLRAAEMWGQPTAPLLNALVDTHLQLKHKEDARGALIKLRALHSAAGNRGELAGIDKRLAELGPGR
ncbi:MAG: hypothetical protein QM817_38640 [Archangium sp.]